MEGEDVQDTEAGIHRAVQGIGCEAGEEWPGGRRGGEGTRSGRGDAAKRGQGGEGWQAQCAGAKPITPEEMELSRMRAENARLRMELEIIKKAAAYFAKDVL